MKEGREEQIRKSKENTLVKQFFKQNKCNERLWYGAWEVGVYHAWLIHQLHVEQGLLSRTQFTEKKTAKQKEYTAISGLLSDQEPSVKFKNKINQTVLKHKECLPNTELSFKSGKPVVTVKDPYKCNTTKQQNE